MKLRQLEAFREVMLTGSVTEAARNMGRTQPAVSALIAGLESSVGYPLFERRKGRLHPVPEAHYLLDQSATILDDLGKLSHNMRAVGRLQEGHLNIACLPVFSTIMLPRLISSFVKDRGNVSVSLVSQSSERVYERLASQQFDVGIAEATTHSPLVTEVETSMDCLCAVAADSDLARQQILTPHDLVGLPMTTFIDGHFIRRQVENAFFRERLDLTIRFEMQNAASQFAFVEDGLAWAIVSPMSVYYYKQSELNQPRIVFIPFRPSIVYRIAVLTPAHTPVSRLARAFSDILVDEVRRVAGLDPRQDLSDRL